MFTLFDLIFGHRNEEYLLWDRESRMDFVFGSGEGHTNLINPPLFTESKYAAATQNTMRLKDKSSRLPSSTSVSSKSSKNTKGKQPLNTTSNQNSHNGSGANGSNNKASSRITTSTGKVTVGQPIPSYIFDTFQDDWVTALPHTTSSLETENQFFETAKQTGKLTVVTFNVLFDLFNTEQIHTAQRIPKILNFLHSLDADIIALEEVTPPFHTELLLQRWVRAHYSISELPAGPTVQPFGQLLLTRLPVEE